MGVQTCTPWGVQRGVQKWGFVRGSCGARNPKVAASFCLPATKVETSTNSGPARRQTLNFFSCLAAMTAIAAVISRILHFRLVSTGDV